MTVSSAFGPERGATGTQKALLITAATLSLKKSYESRKTPKVYIVLLYKVGKTVNLEGRKDLPDLQGFG